jgi:hypothetical protein
VPGPTDDAAAEADATEAGADGPTVAGQCGFVPCPPGTSCPDLIIDRDEMLSSIVIDTRVFKPTDCGVFEGCVPQAGTRRLLRFDTATANVGTADMVIGSPTTGDGGAEAGVAACFEFSACHQHYHFKDFSSYVLYQADGKTVAATGHKQSFCLEDIEQYELQPGPNPAAPFTCTSQGLHVGWKDVYPNDIDCQWIDVTGVPAGSYILSVTVNAARVLPESNYDNNETRVPVTILPQ